MPKLKFPQYKVRGKYRGYYVVPFPNYPYMWPGYDYVYEEYAINADVTGWESLRHAIAILLQAQDRIIYFPTRTNNRFCPMFDFDENYDTVLTVAGLHLKRSEWIRLRRQLKSANRVQNFALSYKPDEIANRGEKFYGQHEYWQIRELKKKIIKEVVNDTVFFSVPEEFYCSYFADSICDDIQEDRYGWEIEGFGMVMPDKVIQELSEYRREQNDACW